MNESLNNSTQLASMSSLDENPNNDIKNDILVWKDTINNLEIQMSSICNEIKFKGNSFLDLSEKYNKYEEVSKENEKCSIDLTNFEWQIQNTKQRIDITKEEVNDIEQLIQNTLIKHKDLEHEKKLVVDKLINKHNAFKRATNYFKMFLNFYIRANKRENILLVTVCLFTQKFDDTFSFEINKDDKESKWTLIGTKPKLENVQFLALQERFNNSNNMCALLCTIRKIFILYIERIK